MNQETQGDREVPNDSGGVNAGELSPQKKDQPLWAQGLHPIPHIL